MPVYKDKKRGTWYFQFTKVINNERITRKKRGFQTKQEATIEEVKALDTLNDDNTNFTLNNVFSMYIEYQFTKLKISSINSVKRQYESHIAPELGNLYLESITIKQISKWKQHLLAKGFAENFTNMIIGVLKRTLDFAIKRDIRFDKTILTELDRVHFNKPTIERQVWTLDQIKTFLDSFVLDDPKEYEYYLYFYGLAYSGMRPNEFRALQVKDIQDDYLVVSKTLNSKTISKQDLLLSPKNVNSNRKVLMPHDYIERLLNHVLSYNPSDYIFGKEKAFRETNLKRMLDKHQKCCELPHIVLYGFRHSHATNLIRAGVPVKVVSKRLGHKDVSTTMNTYWHLFNDDETQVLDVLK